MREIKFRVWDLEMKSFYSPNVHYLSKHDGIVEIILDSSVKKISGENRFIIQQYTGMKDKNGVEIYEGDIVKAYKSNSYLNGEYEVAWHETKGRWYYKNQPDYKDLYQVGCSGNLKCEVIGNIFENPELLNTTE